MKSNEKDAAYAYDNHITKICNAFSHLNFWFDSLNAMQHAFYLRFIVGTCTSTQHTVKDTYNQNIAWNLMYNYFSVTHTHTHVVVKTLFSLD